MKRLLFLIAFLGTISSIWAQTEENLFEWKANQTVATKEKFLGLFSGGTSGKSTYVYKEFDISNNKSDPYTLKIVGSNKTMSVHGSYERFEIYHGNKKILGYLASELLYTVENITVDFDKSYFIKVPLSNDSFALFFGGWLFDGEDAPEMVIVIVVGDTARVVYDDRAYAYKYSSGESFAIEFVTEIDELPITDSFLKKVTKHKIWREGNMLKYKSWK